MSIELGLGDSARVGSAILFIQASTNALDVFSALNSSPWTAESFAADEAKADACREYVWHSIALTSFYAIAGAAISGSPWPIVGTALALVYMYWLYHRALARGLARNSTGWNSTGPPPTTAQATAAGPASWSSVLS
jgi:hypothetical protein